MKLSHLNSVTIIYAVGFTWSLAALFFAAIQYTAWGFDAAAVDGMRSIAPAAKSNAVRFLTDPLQIKIVEGEVSFGRDMYLLLQSMLSARVETARHLAITNVLFAMGPMVVFGALLWRHRS